MKRGLGVAGKLAVAIALFIVPAGILSVLLYKSQQVNIDFGEKEAVGNSYLTELRKVIPAFLARVDQPTRGGRWIQYLAETRRTFETASRHLVDTQLKLADLGLLKPGGLDADCVGADRQKGQLVITGGVGLGVA